MAWCYGSLRAYLDLHDQVMPEVTRIETTYRPPGRKLSEDLKVYADMQKEGRGELKTFQEAMTAAEKASMRPINTVGAGAVAKGRSVWKAGPDVTPPAWPRLDELGAAGPCDLTPRPRPLSDGAC